MTEEALTESIIWRTRWWELEEYNDGELLLPGQSRLDQESKRLLDRTAKAVDEKRSDLPPFPSEAMRAMKKLQEVEPDVSALVAILERSPIITAELLRTANSARYGARVPIDKLSAATTYLGFARVRESVMRAVMGSVTGGLRARQWAMSEWRFAVTAASIAREIGLLVGLDPEQCYVAGLLHDIGRVGLLGQFDQSDHLKRAPEEAEGLDIILECLHRNVGQQIADRWELPPAVSDAITNHISGRADYEESLARFASTRVVEAAGDLCIALGIGRTRRPFAVLDAPSLKQLNIADKDWRNFFDKSLPRAILNAREEV